MISRLLLICLMLGWTPSLWAQCTPAQVQDCLDTCSTFSGGTRALCMKNCEAQCKKKPPPPPPPQFVTISDGTEISADDIAKFDAKWMQPADRANQVNGARCALFFRAG